MGTRSIWLPPDASRSAARDEVTKIGLPLPELSAPEVEFSFAELFAQHYDRIRTTVLKHLQPGVQVFAIDARGVRGELWLKTDGTLRSASIGRHSHADLHLDGDEALSLRHMALLARRVDEALTIRIVDLRTTSGLVDESGRRLAALTTNGPAFVAAGRHRIFLFPTGPGMRWPSSPSDAWLALPPRTFLDAAPAGENPPDFSAATDPKLRNPDFRPSDRVRSPEVTIVPHAAPLECDFRSWLIEGESALGHLVLTHRLGVTRAAVGATAAARGLLLGRYERCELPGLDSTVSRVHALVIRETGALHVVDVGSTNGTLLDGKRISCEPLTPDSVFRLGYDLWLRWEPAT